ncbi:armadillo-type protein [Roridomyces roridus]|uniref:Armadillo-type protein n=1 Tax=Roridomyces roridus TaxID=1738132 RepID=A0AAD7FFQ4_9AGAR|nr:armadillo-type protein [Roridomyces roridus]
MTQYLICLGVYPNAINNAFPNVAKRLLDEDGNVRDAALQAICVIAQSDSHSVLTDDVVEAVSRKFTDNESHVRISAFHTFSTIVKLHNDALQSAIMTIVPVVISPLTSDSKTQIAVLETLCTLAKTEIFAEMVNDVLDQIIALLSDVAIPSHVRIRVLQMLTSLAPQTTFHYKLKAAIPAIALLLESKGEIGTTATATLVDFATNDLFTDSSSDVISQIVSTLSEGNCYTSESILHLLFTIETRAQQAPVEKNSNITVFKYSLGHTDDRVRLAGIRNLRSLFRNMQNPVPSKLVSQFWMSQNASMMNARKSRLLHSTYGSCSSTRHNLVQEPPRTS